MNEAHLIFTSRWSAPNGETLETKSKTLNSIFAILKSSALFNQHHQKREQNLGTHSSKWNVSIKPLPSELRGPCGRGGRDIVRAREGGGHQEIKAFLNQHGRSSYELTETEAACTGLNQTFRVYYTSVVFLWDS